MTTTTKIQILDNGPLLVTGSVELSDAEGNVFEIQRSPVALCRCGASGNKPFCDGVHTKTGFHAIERANSAAD
ncbi:CDGSH iron-sulfur domain-containing protein [Halotia wernerae UHCC 0503]|nr:CDGSH iron-sulfur domain-containing protein [Halotia wernerae UHCC 0503]